MKNNRKVPRKLPPPDNLPKPCATKPAVHVFRPILKPPASNGSSSNASVSQPVIHQVQFEQQTLRSTMSESHEGSRDSLSSPNNEPTTIVASSSETLQQTPIDFEIPCKDIETLFQSKTFPMNSESEDTIQSNTKILRYAVQVTSGSSTHKSKVLPVLSIEALKVPNMGNGDEDLSVVAVGQVTADMLQPIFRYSPSNNRWDVLSALPGPLEHMSMVALQNMIYLGGGLDAKTSTVGTKFLSFNPSSRNWFAERALPEPRSYFCLVVAHQQIYAIGGLAASGHALTTVRCYDPVLKVWHLIRPMKEARIGAACVKHGNLIVVAGGKSQTGVVSRSVECYDLLSKRWKPMNDLRMARCFAKMCSIGDAIYISGGVGSRNDTLWTVDMLDMTKVGDSWRMLDYMSSQRKHHAVAVIGKQLLFLGGGDDGAEPNVPTAQMEAFCCERKVWIVDGFRRTPKLLCESVTCAVLNNIF